MKGIRPAPTILGTIFLGGIAGGLARYGISRAWSFDSLAFPWSTFVVNTTGAFALPLLVVLLARARPSSRLARPLLGTGFLGAYTTFSSVVVSADQQVAHGHVGLAVSYVLGSLAAALTAVVAGLFLGRRVPLPTAAPA